MFKAEEEGVDYERIKALNMAADIADKIEIKRKRKKNPDQGLRRYDSTSTFSAHCFLEAQFRVIQKDERCCVSGSIFPYFYYY
uniref:Uncharacterized protein n=1 Tax=Heterorhabditis bacteriophora TaxID=37862 RepID=A0A1I7X6I8_HETBA